MINLNLAVTSTDFLIKWFHDSRRLHLQDGGLIPKETFTLKDASHSGPRPSLFIFKPYNQAFAGALHSSCIAKLWQSYSKAVECISFVSVRPSTGPRILAVRHKGSKGSAVISHAEICASPMRDLQGTELRFINGDCLGNTIANAASRSVKWLKWSTNEIW